jgi:hypothetical protein
VTFCARIYGEAEALEVARAYQEATPWEERHPPAFGGTPATVGTGAQPANPPKP